jgi:lysozyme
VEPSDNLLNFLRQWEGVGGKPELSAYLDTGHVWTIGYGHTGPEVGPGMTISADEAETLLAHDLALPANMVDKMSLVPLSQCQYDALCAFAFNVGATALHGSTLLKLVNAAQYDRAALQFTRWDHDHTGAEIGGLYKRRVAEQRMLLDADYSMRP